MFTESLFLLKYGRKRSDYERSRTLIGDTTRSHIRTSENFRSNETKNQDGIFDVVENPDITKILSIDSREGRHDRPFKTPSGRFGPIYTEDRRVE